MIVGLDFNASASASQGKGGVAIASCKNHPALPGLGALVSDPVVTEVDVGDRAVGFQSIRECLSGEQRGR